MFLAFRFSSPDQNGFHQQPTGRKKTLDSKTTARLPRTASSIRGAIIHLLTRFAPLCSSSTAHRFDHRPSGNQDQRDQAGVRSPDQDREPAGRDERPPRHHHGNAGQHQPGPVPHYLLVRRADSHPMNHCRRHTFKRVKGQAVLIRRNELFPSAVSNWSPEHSGGSWVCTQQMQQRFPVAVWHLYSDRLVSFFFFFFFLRQNELTGKGGSVM